MNPEAPAAVTGEDLPSYRGLRRDASLLFLLLVNLLPLYGIVRLDWDVAALMILYWSENLVLGFYTLLKMLLRSPLAGLFSGLFFCIHYGGFCAVHGLFLLTFLTDVEPKFFSGEPWPLFLVFVQLLIEVVQQVLDLAPPAWLYAFLGLFVSHGVSFLANFVLVEERDRLSLRQLMGAPYGRIVVLHIAIILGGFAVMALGQPLGMLLVLIALKLGLDIHMHLREHRRLA